MKEKVLKIMELALELKPKGVDAFVNYSPHVNALDVDFYPNGWNEDNIGLIDFYVYLHREDTNKQLDRVINQLKEML